MQAAAFARMSRRPYTHVISNQFDKKYLLDSTSAGIYFRALTVRERRESYDWINSRQEKIAGPSSRQLRRNLRFVCLQNCTL